MNAETKATAAEAALNEESRSQCLRVVCAYVNRLADKIESSPRRPTARQLKDLEVCERLLRVLLREEASL